MSLLNIFIVFISMLNGADYAFHKLIGVWFVNQWMTSGKKDVQLVELGPGRGTLAADVLRVCY